MAHLDVRDFALLEALARTGSVSLTAEELGLSQPSVSIRLGKLRSHFNDPLFVRTSAGMQATPRAIALVPAVRSALRLLAGEEGGDAAFDPATSDRVFRLSMTNIGHVVVISRLQRRLSELAPHVRVEVTELTARTPQQLESGEVDLALGYTLEMRAGFYQQQLFVEYYVCIVRADHPRIRGDVTPGQFAEELHVAVKTDGTAHWMLDKAIVDAGITRRIALWVPSFLGLSEIVASTDLIGLMPVHLARVMSRHGTVRIVRAPIPSQTYSVRQYWHERYHRDPGNRWLRELAAQVLSEEREAA